MTPRSSGIVIPPGTSRRRVEPSRRTESWQSSGACCHVLPGATTRPRHVSGMGAGYCRTPPKCASGEVRVLQRGWRSWVVVSAAVCSGQGPETLVRSQYPWKGDPEVQPKKTKCFCKLGYIPISSESKGRMPIRAPRLA
eukprot:6922145-Heterocapsa_arctica.AAC.1